MVEFRRGFKTRANDIALGLRKQARAIQDYTPGPPGYFPAPINSDCPSE